MTLVTLARAEDLFGKLRSEDEQAPDRKFEVEPNSALEAIIRSFERTLESRIGSAYRDAAEIHKGFTVRAEDIEKFSLICPSYGQNEIFNLAAFIYLNELIRSCCDPDIVIHTSRLKTPLSNLCRSNEDKNITIYGDVGIHLGDRMKSGLVHVHGSAGDYVGEAMRGGEIIIEGNAGPSIGSGMEDGTIRINRDDLGLASSLGEGMTLGRIFYRGKLVVQHG